MDIVKVIVKKAKQDVVLTASWILAVGSAFVIPPDGQYIEYIDWKTLSLLFCLMAIMGGLQNRGFFTRIGSKFIQYVKGSVSLSAILIFLCFFSSMLITNDVALITFVPFSIIILSMIEKRNYIIPIVTMQTIAANLGSMMTPIGNPQNLYLYSKMNIGLLPFMKIMFPFAVVTVVLLIIFLATLKREKIRHVEVAIDYQAGGNGKEWMYGILFLLAIGVIAGLLPVVLVLGITVVVIGWFDRKVFLKVDYALLFTFVGFFLFIGNMKRIPQFSELLSSVLQGNEVLTAIISSQLISNVPSALLLSGFTDQMRELVIGTNLGGLGTLIASMASLISYKQVVREIPEKKGAYLIYFTGANIVFLAILMIQYYFMYAK